MTGLAEKISPQLRGATLANNDDDEVPGVRVTEVQRDSSAWKEGLRKNDLIVAINRQRVKSLEDVKQIVSGDSSKLLLQIQRGSSALFLVIR